MQLGKIQTLIITRFSPNGAYLSDKAQNQIAQKDCQINPKAKSSQKADCKTESKEKADFSPKAKSSPQNSTQNSTQNKINPQNLQNPKNSQNPTNPHTAQNPQSHLSINEVLLPNRFCPSGAKIGDEVSAFIYTDFLDRFIATTQKPLATLDDIAFLRVASVVANGVFLDMGLDKDIFMPSKNPKSYALNSLVCVKICADKSARLIAKKGIKDTLKPYKTNQNHRGKKVAILPFEASALGVGCVVEGKYYGLVYASPNNQKSSKDFILDFGAKSSAKSSPKSAQPLVANQKTDFSAMLKKLGLNLGVQSFGFIQNVRKDGKLDITLNSRANAKDEAQKIIEILCTLKAKNIALDFGYDSPQQILEQTFGTSKKGFKRALTHLISAHQIELKNGKIILLKS